MWKSIICCIGNRSYKLLTFIRGLQVHPSHVFPYPNPEQFLSRLWATSSVGGCGFGHTGGQDAGLIITQLDLNPAPDGLLPVPDTSLSKCLEGWMHARMEGVGNGPGLTASSSSRGILPRADPTPRSANWLIFRLLSTPLSACSPLLPLRSTLLPQLPFWLSAAGSHWVCVRVCVQRCAECVCWTADVAGSGAALAAKCSEPTSDLVNI